MTKSELKERVMATESHFFDRDTMKFFGDTMANYGVRETKIDTYREESVEVYELYRRKPVKYGLQSSHYFDKKTFKKHPRKKWCYV